MIVFACRFNYIKFHVIFLDWLYFFCLYKISGDFSWYFDVHTTYCMGLIIYKKNWKVHWIALLLNPLVTVLCSLFSGHNSISYQRCLLDYKLFWNKIILKSDKRDFFYTNANLIHRSETMNYWLISISSDIIPVILIDDVTQSLIYWNLNIVENPQFSETIVNL